MSPIHHAIAGALIVAGLLGGLSSAIAAPRLFFVNTASDAVVANACANNASGCSLRGAILAANSNVGEDGIDIDLPAGSVINLAAALPDVSDGVAITGLGADKLTVRRGTTGYYRISNITTTGAVAFSGMTMSNGAAPDGGGFKNTNSGTVNVSQCVISGNEAESGGGVYNQSTGVVNISNSVIAGNITTGGGYFGSGGGGGIFNITGTVNVTNCTISGNSGTEGGGIHSRNTGTVNLSNSTITGNTALFGFTGGGVDHSNAPTGLLRVKSCIIAGNISGTGAPDVPGQDVNGPFNTAGFNLIGKIDGANGFNAVTDQKGTNSVPLDARLNPNGLQNNGGPTKTIALRFGSPAIDKGTSNGLAGNLTTDQRGSGFPRTFNDPNVAPAAGGDNADIGAFEVEVVPGLVANVSTRLPVGVDDNVLIEGFIVQGPAGSTKKILVRAIGPSLIPFGIADALANPSLEIRDGNNLTIARNDNWRTTQIGGIITADQAQEISTSGAPPTKDFESAIIANLAPGSYTAVVAGSGRTVGTGVVDAYDLSAASPARLANVATRGVIAPGDKLMIAGFIIQNGPVRAVVCAIGPSLTAFGINNALPDTTLQIKTDNGTTVIENDNWQTTQKAELEQTTLQPSHPLEAAVVVTLPPGQYSAQVRGNPETTGVGVVQVYFLQ